MKRKDEKMIPMSEDELNNYAVWLNSPWRQKDESYIIQCNCKDAYTEMKPPYMKCTYTIIGYDGISASVVGYGDTEELALKDCLDRFKYLQENYNKDGDVC